MTTVYQETEADETPQLKLLRRLVTVLLMVLIIGVVTIVLAIALRLKTPTNTFVAPDTGVDLVLPQGLMIATIGSGQGKLFVTTQDQDGDTQSLLIYDAQTLALEQSVPIVTQQ